MKTKLFLILGLALSINAMAQTTASNQPKTYHKATAIITTETTYQTPQPDKEYFKMSEGQMRAVKGGVSTAIPADRWLANKTVITPEGLVVTYSGKKLYLKDGETIDGNGIITSGRCNQLAGQSNGGTCMVQ